MITMNDVNKFIKDLEKEKMVKKNLYNSTWTSGSSTTVYPIAIYTNSWKSEIILQWNSNRACNAFINKMVQKYNNLIEWGLFWKADNSCPSIIIFRLKERIESGR